MHTVRDAKVFIDSLNPEQRRALASALLIYSSDAGDDQHTTALASRLCEAILLARTISHIGGWKHY